MFSKKTFDISEKTLQCFYRNIAVFSSKYYYTFLTEFK